MNMTFKVNPKPSNSFFEFIYLINSIQCKIFYDCEKGTVYAINVERFMVDEIIDTINKYFDIESTKMEISNEDETSLDKNYQNLVNKISKNVKSVLDDRKVEEHDIKRILLSCSDDLMMKNKENESIDVKEGDLVQCNFGQNLSGEISGNKVPSVVVEVRGKMIRVIPLIRKTNIMDGYLATQKNQFENINYEIEEGYWAICKILFIRNVRINSVIGSVTPMTLKLLKGEVSKYFYFESGLKMESEKEALFNVISDKIKNPNIKDFLNSIGFKSSPEVIAAFEVAKKLDKINYENIMNEIVKKTEFESKTEKEIRGEIRHKFDLWLMENPELKKKFSRISIMTLIKLYVENN